MIWFVVNLKIGYHMTTGRMRYLWCWVVQGYSAVELMTGRMEGNGWAKQTPLGPVDLNQAVWHSLHLGMVVCCSPARSTVQKKLVAGWLILSLWNLAQCEKSWMI